MNTDEDLRTIFADVVTIEVTKWECPLCDHMNIIEGNAHLDEAECLKCCGSVQIMGKIMYDG